ncbi:Peroxin-3-like protein [Elsinoe fawcettii]|nr:Peroxin-3-like protein [Elsinoe fawcettii]
MLERTRQWFWRNRTRFAIGAATVSGIYLAGQYAWGKWLEAQQRMGEERIAKENLRRRFEQNQEDCTYTVLALLPTVRDEVIGAFPVEEISTELQKQKAERLARSVGGLSEVASTDLPSGPPSAMDDSGSLNGSFVHASQMAESSAGGQLRPKKSKVQLWYDMKVQSITRSITLLYTLSLLTLLTRIQLNLLGRRTYLSSVVSLASPPQGQQASTISLENNDDDNFDNVYGSDFETNRQYLTFSWWLLHRGCKDISAKVAQAVREVFGPIDPRADMTLEKLSILILDVRKKIEGATETERTQQHWLPFLLPPKDQEEAVLREPSATPSPDSPSGRDLNPLDTPQLPTKSTTISPSLRRLLDETSDLIDSPTFTHVLTQLLNATFSHLIDARVASEAFKLPRGTTSAPLDPSTLTPENRITELTDRKVKLASTLAVFCRQAHVIAAGSGDMEDISAAEGGSVNEYLAAIDGVKDLEAFAAVIYSSNFEFESIQEEQRRIRERESRRALREQGGEEEVLQTVEVEPFESAWSKALDREDGKEGERA